MNESNITNESIENLKNETNAENTDETKKDDLDNQEKQEKNPVPEERPMVQKIKVDDSNFEYNRNLANKKNDDFDINLSEEFDDRMGSSSLDDATNSSENDSII